MGLEGLGCPPEMQGGVRSGREALSEGCEELEGLPGMPGGLWRLSRWPTIGRESVLEGQEGSGGPVGGLRGFGARWHGRLAQKARRGWEDLPEGWEWSGGLPRGPGVVGRPHPEGREGSGGPIRMAGRGQDARPEG